MLGEELLELASFSDELVHLEFCMQGPSLQAQLHPSHSPSFSISKEKVDSSGNLHMKNEAPPR